MSTTTLRQRIAARTSPVSTVPAPSPGPAAGPFVDDAWLATLPSLSREEIDGLDFGVIKVDDSGVIQLYNQFQSRFASLPVPQAEGKNFFAHLALCTNNKIFHGAFKQGVASGSLNTSFPYAFNYKVRPTLVQVHLYRDEATRTNWILIKPL